MKIEIGGNVINANLNRNDNHTTFLISEHNNPKAVNQLRHSLKNMGEGDEVKVHSTKAFIKNNIRKSDLKTLFLTMAAKFGYTIAFNQRLDIVREILAEKETNLRIPLLYLDTNTQLNDKIIIDEKAGIFGMQIDDRLAFCPWPSHPIKRFTNHIKRNNLNIEFTIKGSAFDMPESFEALLDTKAMGDKKHPSPRP